MNSTSAKITFKKIGITVPGLPRKVSYFPVVNIEYDNEKKKCQICLMDLIADKKSIKHLLMGKTFIVIQVSDEFRVFNMEGKKVGSVSADEYGEELVAICEDGFVLRKDKTITWIDDKAEVIKSHSLTEEELKESEI